MKNNAATAIIGRESDISKPMDFKELLRVLVYALVFAAIIRSLLFSPFHIPSGSMKSSLLVGDYLFVSKYSYGYSRYSFPFGFPIFTGRVFESAPQRGDVIVFRNVDAGQDYIKRLIGLPGDRIKMVEGTLYLNGSPILKRRIEDFTDDDEVGRMIPRYLETLPNGVTYEVLDETPEGRLDNTGEYTVPENHYFMMGDNRDNSQDSRVLNAVGYVPAENLIGKARLVLFSANPAQFKWWRVWAWHKSLRNDRFVKKIQ